MPVFTCRLSGINTDMSQQWFIHSSIVLMQQWLDTMIHVARIRQVLITVCQEYDLACRGILSESVRGTNEGWRERHVWFICFYFFVWLESVQQSKVEQTKARSCLHWSSADAIVRLICCCSKPSFWDAWLRKIWQLGGATNCWNMAIRHHADLAY